MDKVKFNPFSEILDKDFNQQAEYVDDAVSMFIKDFLTEDKAVVLGLDIKAQAVADMTVYVAPGRLYQVGKQGQLTVNSNPPLTITAAHPNYDRIDRICARYAEIDDEPETRNVMIDTVSRQVVQKTVMTRVSGTVEFLVVSGVAAPVPAAPTVPDSWVSLARVNVKQNAVEISQENIIDERPTVSAYLAHRHTGGGDGARIDYKDVQGTPDLNAINAATASRLKPVLAGGWNQCYLLCKLPKNSMAFVHYKILGAQHHDKYAVLEFCVKGDGIGWCEYRGISANWQVYARAYETENSIDVYVFSPNYCDIWKVFLKNSGASPDTFYTPVGDVAYKPTGTQVCDTVTGIGMTSVKITNGHSTQSTLLRDTEYKKGDVETLARLPSWAVLECITAGKTAVGELTFPINAIGQKITDGTCMWVIRHKLDGHSIGDIWMFMGTFTDGHPINIETGLARWDVQLCDGKLGTVNMTNRFPMGTNDVLQFAEQGGSNNLALTAAQMPAHGHTGTTTVAGWHGHAASAWTDAQGNHAHGFPMSDNTGGGGYSRCTQLAEWTAYTDTQGSHAHNVGISIIGDGNHQHTFTTANTGSSAAFDNRPAYTAVAFVQKIY